MQTRGSPTATEIVAHWMSPEIQHGDQCSAAADFAMIDFLALGSMREIHSRSVRNEGQQLAVTGTHSVLFEGRHCASLPFCQRFVLVGSSGVILATSADRSNSPADLPNSISSASAMAMKISVVGGGRWARTIAAVLGTMPGRSDSIIVHSPRNSAGIEAWISERRLGDRVTAAGAWPSFGSERDRPDAVVIANRVDDHFAAAAAALRAGIPVLVEKPVCLLRSRIEDLCEIADASGTVFGASHVFLFATIFPDLCRVGRQPGSIARPPPDLDRWRVRRSARRGKEL